MKSTPLKIVEQLVNRCPKSGRITGLRRGTRLAKILLPIWEFWPLAGSCFEWFPSPAGPPIHVNG